MTVGQQASADRFYCACGCFTLTVTAARRPRSAKGSSPRSHRLMIEQLSGGGVHGGPEIDGCSARAMPGEESHSGREWEWAKGLGVGLGVGLHGSAIFVRVGAASLPLPGLSVSQRQDRLARFSPWSRLLHLLGATLRRTIWASRIHGMVQRRRSCTPSATASARSGGRHGRVRERESRLGFCLEAWDSSCALGLRGGLQRGCARLLAARRRPRRGAAPLGTRQAERGRSRGFRFVLPMARRP